MWVDLNIQKGMVVILQEGLAQDVGGTKVTRFTECQASMSVYPEIRGKYIMRNTD